ncbi:MAG TPA: zinc metalloprotease HtpX [Candidatus Nanoarchaeia archaeon]|nr:zinc metalloprotease HtpX [Candidatus Nanoarchaeia archaeon]
MAVLNQFKTVMLLGLLTGLLLGVGFLVGGQQGLLIALIFSVLMNFGTYWFSDRIVLAMYRAKQITHSEAPELFSTVKGIAHLAGMPMPKVYMIPSEAANAFATGRNPAHAAVAVTHGIMRILSKDELKGVLAHEMAHVKNRDILITTIAATIAGVISFIATMAQWSAMFGGFGGRDSNREGGGLVGLLALAIVTPLIAMLLQLALSRSREYLADEIGAKMIHNPLALASALEKLESETKRTPLRMGSEATSSLFIVNPFRAGMFLSLMSTHPPMAERIKRLREM